MLFYPHKQRLFSLFLINKIYPEGDGPARVVLPATSLNVHLVDAPEVQLTLDHRTTHDGGNVQLPIPQVVENAAEDRGVAVKVIAVHSWLVVALQQAVIGQDTGGQTSGDERNAFIA